MTFYSQFHLKCLLLISKLIITGNNRILINILGRSRWQVSSHFSLCSPLSISQTAHLYWSHAVHPKMHHDEMMWWCHRNMVMSCPGLFLIFSIDNSNQSKNSFRLFDLQYKDKDFIENYLFAPIQLHWLWLGQKQFPRPIGHRNNIP